MHPHDPSDSSFISADLNDLVPPSYRNKEDALSANGGEEHGAASVYGGIAPSLKGGDHGGAGTGRGGLGFDGDHGKGQGGAAETMTDWTTERSYQTAQACPPFNAPTISSGSQRHSAPSQTLQPPPSVFTYPSNSHSSGSSPYNSNNLPTFSRWSPTWVSGGYSSDGAGFTYHPPPSSYHHAYEDPYGAPPPSHRAYDYGRHERDIVDHEGDSGYGWLPEPPPFPSSQSPSRSSKSKLDPSFSPTTKAGTYQHGVGFPSPETSGRESSKKVAARMARLEKEFGEVAIAAGEEHERNMNGPGGVRFGKKEMEEMRKREKSMMREKTGLDESGRLIVKGGKKKRVALRVLESVLTLGILLGVVGASFFTKPANGTPPQGHKPSFYALFILPVLCLSLTTYFLIIKPCKTKSRIRKAGGIMNLGLPGAGGGGMVIPLNTAQGGGGGGLWGGKKDKMKNGQQQINLFMDPRMFPQLLQPQYQPSPLGSNKPKKKKRKRRHRRRNRKEQEGDDSDTSLTSLTSLDSSSDDSDAEDEDLPYLPPIPNPQLQAMYDTARGDLKKILACDFILGLLCMLVGFWAVLGGGGTCASGSEDGWCDYYNLSIAFSIISGVCFFGSFGLGIVALKRTGRGPPMMMGGVPRRMAGVV